MLRACSLFAAALVLIALAMSERDNGPGIGSVVTHRSAISNARMLPATKPKAGCGHIGLVTGRPIEVCLVAASFLDELIRDFNRDQAAMKRHRRLERKRRHRERVAHRRASRRARAARPARYVSENQANPPRIAPERVRRTIAAANAIAATPYIWGGGHESFSSLGYDCSGAVSYALHGGGFLETPLDSHGLETWGRPGPGKWITIYANDEHAWMTVAGLTFDTVGGPGPRWHTSPGDSPDEYIVRHPAHY